ncbi:MAG: TonB-dependent receptor plug domain-containing protein [Verrucomicrobia bacterium]|nr:TonB-dependent receptor plug domain-containing protein [Verrucomicrobiota bacterium]MDA1069683.1 TonB-dependent receptor plug domain-containing protein [Verrucomicrobiota bacterium]
MTQITFSKLNALKYLQRFVLVFSLMGAPALFSQEDADEEKVFELSPFTVESDETVGYMATTTLAGTRIKSDLKDIASSISIYTKEFMQDTGATSIQELLVYTTGTEVAGLGGNFSNERDNGGFVLDFSGERFTANSTTRVRGLAAADNTRNYFSSVIPLDSYNISRVTINRGANNILFGLGSPAGIIDRSLSRPINSNANEVSFRVDKYGSLRGTFDVNRVLVEDKVNVRVIGLHDWRQFQQIPSFDKSRRLYGALDYLPFENTTIRFNVEVGDRDGSPEVLAPPRDRLSYWWSELDQLTVGPGESNQPQPFFTDIAATNRNPLFLNNVGATQPFLGVISLNEGTGLQGAILQEGDPLFNQVPANQRNNYRPRFITVNDPNRVNRAANPGVDAADYSRSLQITDTSVFDYNNVSMSGRNDRRFNDFTAFNIAIQQELLEGDLGFELTYDKQDFDSGSFDLIGGGFRNRNIGVDINEAFADGTPNPNVGRPFVTARPGWSENHNELETSRLTVFYKFDAEEKLGGIGKWLGKHTLTGLLDQSKLKTLDTNGPAMILDTDFGDDIGYAPANNIINGWLWSQNLYYIGDSLLGASSARGANLPGLPAHVDLPNQVDMLFISTPTRDFERGTYNTLLYPENKNVLVSGATRERNETESRALAWQSHWFDEILVGTLGWRNDKFKNYDAGQAPQDFRGSRQIGANDFKLPTTPDIDTEGNTFSWGLVAHTPKGWKENMPIGMDISLHYGESENFAPSAVARNPFGGFFSPPSGTTEDYGATISLFDNKIIARFTWYETVQQNLFDNRLVGPYLWFFYQVPQQVYNNNPTADVLAANFELPVQAIQDAYRWNYITNPDGSIAIDGEGIGAGDVIQAVSKGFEMDLTANLTRNWRVSVNAAQQEAVRTGTGQTGIDEVNRLAAAWLGNPAQGDLLENNNNPVRGRITQQLALFNNALANDGQKANELREWRINMVTNYTFSNAKLKGFGLGGAIRYQSKAAIGNELRTDPELGVIPDISRPYFGPSDTKVDTWFSYRTKFINDIDWILQLNIRNVLNEKDLIPTWYNPDGTGFTYASAKEQDWFLTSTFKF